MRSLICIIALVGLVGADSIILENGCPGDNPKKVCRIELETLKGAPGGDCPLFSTPERSCSANSNPEELATVPPIVEASTPEGMTTGRTVEQDENVTIITWTGNNANGTTILNATSIWSRPPGNITIATVSKKALPKDEELQKATCVCKPTGIDVNAKAANQSLITALLSNAGNRKKRDLDTDEEASGLLKVIKAAQEHVDQHLEEVDGVRPKRMMNVEDALAQSPYDADGQVNVTKHQPKKPMRFQRSPFTEEAQELASESEATEASQVPEAVEAHQTTVTAATSEATEAMRRKREAESYLIDFEPEVNEVLEEPSSGAPRAKREVEMTENPDEVTSEVSKAKRCAEAKKAEVQEGTSEAPKVKREAVDEIESTTPKPEEATSVASRSKREAVDELASPTTDPAAATSEAPKAKRETEDELESTTPNPQAATSEVSKAKRGAEAAIEAATEKPDEATPETLKTKRCAEAPKADANQGTSEAPRAKLQAESEATEATTEIPRAKREDDAEKSEATIADAPQTTSEALKAKRQAEDEVSEAIKAATTEIPRAKREDEAGKSEATATLVTSISPKKETASDANLSTSTTLSSDSAANIVALNATLVEVEIPPIKRSAPNATIDEPWASDDEIPVQVVENPNFETVHEPSVDNSTTSRARLLLHNSTRIEEVTVAGTTTITTKNDGTNKNEKITPHNSTVTTVPPVQDPIAEILNSNQTTVVEGHEAAILETENLQHAKREVENAPANVVPEDDVTGAPEEEKKIQKRSAQFKPEANWRDNVLMPK
ncbi:unnamed protein product, partial [Mesorhabditis spiculigera]